VCDQMKKRNLNCLKTLCVVLAVLLAISIAGCGQKAAEETVPETVSPTTEPAVKELSVTDLLKAVLTLKDDLETALEDIKEDELDAAAAKVEGLFPKTQTIRESMAVTMTNLGDSMPSLTVQLENIQEVLNLVDLASEELLLPAIRQMKTLPIELERVGDGVRTDMVCEYVDFAASLMPGVEAVIQKANTVDLSVVDSDGDLASHLEGANKLLELYQNDKAVFDRIKAILGGDGDRTYLIAAQNSSEIRASGGFPGAMGVIRIRDGVLTMEDFKRVYDTLVSYTPAKANVTNEEYRLFHGGLSAPRDADYCPDFERVAYIWTLGYEAAKQERLDGVISVTPAVVQKLLTAMDREVRLFDGTVLNGENATRVLQYDLYYKYFGREYVNNAQVVADQVFADAAKKTVDELMGNMSMANLMDYMSVGRECFEDRTLMLWMADESEQAIMRTLNCHGGLNSDPEKPQAGVYFNCYVPSKMGWFLVMDTEMGERVRNADGSYTYPITVTLSNAITQEEIADAGYYITGGLGGAIGSSVYFFAPAGGTVSDFVTSIDKQIALDEYNNLQLGHMLSFQIQPGQTITVTYNITTAPGVETMLEFSKTPTVQNYH